ncbi:hypothetical protein J6590_086216 [Homalodisca vitripennis]|nr:hypothetical protein J6590_086216 [Homalodisca vitripennis]
MCDSLADTSQTQLLYQLLRHLNILQLLLSDYDRYSQPEEGPENTKTVVDSSEMYPMTRKMSSPGHVRE